MSTAGRLFVHHDTGAPLGRGDYTTLIVIHGYVWHAGSFSKLIPLASTYGVRIILLNRRGYPGSVPYTAGELALLPPVPDKPRADKDEIKWHKEMLEKFMYGRAQELHATLEDLVLGRDLPRIRSGSGPQRGGIVLVGWSLGATWVTALLSHVSTFPVGKIKLNDYVRRAVLSDPPVCLLGYPYPERDPWNPLFDTSLTYEERGKVFTDWITAYFKHGDAPNEFERRRALQTPPSTLASMTLEDFEATVYVPPGVPGGADWKLLHGCCALGVYGPLRIGALFLPTETETGEKRAAGDEWRDVEVRYVWGDCSVWEVPLAARLLREEVDGGSSDGKPMRRFTSLCIKGANHFAQWDFPERTLQAFLADESACDA